MKYFNCYQGGRMGGLCFLYFHTLLWTILPNEPISMQLRLSSSAVSKPSAAMSHNLCAPSNYTLGGEQEREKERERDVT